MKKERVFSIDLLKILACYMVIQVHAGEFYYIGDGGTVIHDSNSIWVSLLNSLCRSAVPLFIMITGFLVLPVKDRMNEFFKRRFTRVLFPFVIWCIIYACYQFFKGQTGSIADVWTNILNIPINYGVEVGHLWYIYMLMGLYLFFPIISPWLEKASRSNLHFYLAIWAVTLCLPYIHLVFPAIWGECSWNTTPMLYYFSGYLGYAILGFYVKKFCLEKSKWDIPLALGLIGAGYVVTSYIFTKRFATEEFVWTLELSWGFGTINVAMITLGLFMLFKNIGRSKNAGTVKVVNDISNMTYGMYLAHIIVLNLFYDLFNGMFESALIKIPIIAVCSFIGSYVLVKIISYIPKSKYIIG